MNTEEKSGPERITSILRWDPNRSFAETVKAYEQLEAEWIARAGADESRILETKRYLADVFFVMTSGGNAPFEYVQDTWNRLRALGFADIITKQSACSTYAFYCLDNEHYDAGLAVLEPVIPEFEQWLQVTVHKPKPKNFYEELLDGLKFLREGLVAFRTSEAEAQAWLERYEARGPSSQEVRESDLRLELIDAMNPIRAASSERGFAETVCAYRDVEADFLARLQPDDQFIIPKAKRRITFAILQEAHKHRQPFEICRDLWNETLSRGFPEIESRCDSTWLYADCCLFNQQPDAGLAVVEPLLAELSEHLYGDADSEFDPEFYERKIARLEKLRDELQALKK